MPTPFSRWYLMADGTALAYGDTLVAGGDTIHVATTVQAGLAPGQYTLRVVVDSLGVVRETDESNNAVTRTLQVANLTGASSDAPTALALSSPFPNPSTREVHLGLSLPRAARIEFEVHDLQGREVWSQRARDYAPGRWTLSWSGLAQGRRVAPGIYLARVTVNGVAITRRLAIVR
jgi:hypothetical protein